MKGLVTRNTHVQYESPISSGKKVIAKVKVFVHTSNADADTDTRAMTLAPRTFFPAHCKYRKPKFQGFKICPHILHADADADADTYAGVIAIASLH